jgi:hypothetical protein
MKEEIRIEYDGKWPCLCMGHLKVYIGETLYDFGKYVLISGGYIERDDDWNMWAEEGSWSINEDNIPENFPKDRIKELIDEINCTIPHGCCGGCI